MKYIIELAKQADPGFEFRGSGAMADCLVGLNTIERFAALVRAQALEEAAVACEDLDEEASWKEDRLASGHECAAAVRELMKERLK